MLGCHSRLFLGCADAMLCYAMVCYAHDMICYAMLCCAILDARGRRVSPFTLAFPMEFLHFGIQGGAACLRSPLLFLWNSFNFGIQGGAARLRAPSRFLWNSFLLASRGAPRGSVHPCVSCGMPTFLHPGGHRASPFTLAFPMGSL